MAYTVKQLAELAGTSVRTLRFYDEIGLLKPAYLGANGYRYYEEEQLLQLQQILFYRELGIGLNQIQEVLSSREFDKISALKKHRQQLQKNMRHTQRLILTIDQTIEHLKGKRTMKPKQFFAGFDPVKQAEHERTLIEQYGPDMERSIAASKRKVRHWKEAEWTKAGLEFAAICSELAVAQGHRLDCGAPEVQALVRRHYRWLQHFWKPNRASYPVHADMIEFSELGKAYEAYAPGLAAFMAAGIRKFAETEME